MDWMQFVAGMTTALAWPIVALIVFLAFREQLIRLIPKLREVTAPGGFAARFEEVMDKVEADIPPPDSAVLNENVWFADEVQPETDPLALKHNPSGVIMERWRDVETALRSFVPESSTVSIKGRPMPVVDLANILLTEHLITIPEMQAFTEMRSIRNVVAHASDVPVTEEQAVRFTGLADKLLRTWKIRQNTVQVPNRL